MLVRQGYDEFVLIHIASGRVLDAYVNPDAAMASKHGADYRAYTARQTLAGVDGNVSSQVWRIRHIAVAPAMDGIYRFSSLGRSLEQGTSEMPGAFAAATSDDAPGQLWELKRLEGETYQIAKSGPTRTYLSALIGPTFAASINIAAEWGFCSAMVPGVDSPSTYWYAKHVQGDRFKFRQQETGRFLSSIIAANTEPAVVSKAWLLLYCRCTSQALGWAHAGGVEGLWGCFFLPETSCFQEGSPQMFGPLAGWDLRPSHILRVPEV